jgi:hypothetical protein
MKVTNEDLEPLWKALRMLGWGAVALVLTAPLVAMQFTEDVHWTASDFGFAGALLIGGGAVIELFDGVCEIRPSGSASPCSSSPSSA